jgi:hypothetical protein
MRLSYRDVSDDRVRTLSSDDASTVLQMGLDLKAARDLLDSCKADGVAISTEFQSRLEMLQDRIARLSVGFPAH